jgi:hypothetical protein
VVVVRPFVLLLLLGASCAESEAADQKSEAKGGPAFLRAYQDAGFPEAEWAQRYENGRWVDVPSVQMSVFDVREGDLIRLSTMPNARHRVKANRLERVNGKLRVILDTETTCP